MKVYEAIAAAVAVEVPTVVFGVMGDGNMSFWAALSQTQTRIVSARHEAAAVLMADGFAQASGKTGFATLTYGPGFTHAATSILTAARGRIPLVIFIGSVPENERNNQQRVDQKAFAAACEVPYVELTDATTIVQDVRNVFKTARGQRTPIVLAVPVDLQEAPYTGLQSVLAAVPAESECPALPAAPELEKLTEAVLHSRFPLIVAGKGAIDARLELMALGETIGALVGTTLPTKGLFGGETYDAGIIGGLSSTETEKLIEQTDLVIAFGASMNHFTRGEGRYFKNCKLICIDRDATREVPLNGTLVHGDAKATAVALHDELKSRGHSNIGHRKPEIANRLESAGVIQPGAASDDGLDPRKLFRRIAAALPRDVQVSTGLGHFWSFSTLYLPHKWPARSYFSVGFGAIGSALPLGIGVRMARQTERCVVIEGDGSLLQHLQELETAAKLGLPITVIVANDSGYGAEVHKLKQKGHNSALAQWSSIDFAGVARACGGEGVTVVSDDEIDNALKAAERADGLFLIDCRISPTTTSDVYNRKILGMAVEVPLLRAG